MGYKKNDEKNLVVEPEKKTEKNVVYLDSI
jgi:hypothetical protein